MSDKKFSIDNYKYVGIGFSNIEVDGAYSMLRSLNNRAHAGLYADALDASYSNASESVTVECLTSSPDFAVESLAEHARIARLIDKLSSNQTA